LEISCFVENQPAPEPPRTDPKIPFPRGPREMPLRHPVTPGDQACLLKTRLEEMAKDPQRQDRVRADITAIYHLLRRCKTRKDATGSGNGKNTNSIGMKVRHLHDNLDLHVHRNCLGALYRSGDINAKSKNNELAGNVHQEHTIPTSVVAGLLYDHFRCVPIEVLANYLLTETVVTAVSRQERTNNLNRLRSYGDDPRRIAWAKEHPEFSTDKPIQNPDAKLFLRYHGTKLEIFCWATGVEEQVDPETYTLKHHQDRISQYKLFDYKTYFSPKTTPLNWPLPLAA
jgi:hypothetical protein